MKKVLVTGGAGFIGSHVCDLLLVNGFELYVIDNLSTGKEVNIPKEAKFFKEDLTNHLQIEEIFKKIMPNIVYILAAQIDVRKSVENPCFDAQQNIINTLNLLELCKKYNVEHVVFSSSGGTIYGDTQNIPTGEENEAKPVSPYGCAKLSIEKYLHYYHEVYGLHYTALRYANVYGPRQNPKGEAGVISIFFSRLLDKQPITVFGGSQTRDYVFAGDVAKANLLALNDRGSEIYNIGTGIETSVNELCQKIKEFFYYKPKIIFADKKKGEQEKSCLNYSKAIEGLGWMPEVKLDEGLKKTYDWYKENYSQ